MATGYSPLDNEFGANPKVRRAFRAGGADAVLLFVALVTVHRRYGSHGVIPPKHANPEQLGLHLPALEWSEERLSELIVVLESVDLIQQLDQGIRISGFDSDWQPKCANSRCRKPNPEPAYAWCPDCRSKERNRKTLGNSKPNGAHSDHDGTRTSEDVGVCGNAWEDVGSGGKVRESVVPGLTSTSTSTSTPETESAPRSELGSSRSGPDPDQIQTALERIGWGTPRQRKRMAPQLAERGATAEAVQDLWAACRANGRDPLRLLSHHLKRNPEAWPSATGSDPPEPEHVAVPIVGDNGILAMPIYGEEPPGPPRPQVDTGFDRKVRAMHEYDRLSPEQIAERVGVSVEMVQEALRRE